MFFDLSPPLTLAFRIIHFLNLAPRLNWYILRMMHKGRLKVTILDSRGHPTEAQTNEKLEELLTLRLNKLFRKTQKEQADILALGQYFRKHLTREQLQDWRAGYYPNLDFKLRVTTVIENRGNLKSL